jgi:signal transduction histidine kinase
MNIPWNDDDVSSDPTSWGPFIKLLVEAISELSNKTHIVSAYCAIAGVKIATYEPIYSFGQLTNDQISADIAERTRSINENRLLPQITITSDRIFVPLIDSGELYGFVNLWGQLGDSTLVTNWARDLSALAEYKYARRARMLLDSINETADIEYETSINVLAEKAATITASSFGADCVLLHLFDPELQELVIKAQAGRLAPLVDSEAFSRIAHSVFASANRPWLAIDLSSDPPWRGHRDPDLEVEIINDLETQQIRSVLCVRLDDLSPVGSLGTLLYCFERPHSFSWKDIALFHSFCRRTAAALILATRLSEMTERTRILEIQSPIFTQVEIAHLLLHDLSHKLLDVESSGTDLIDLMTKRLGRYETITAETSDAFATFYRGIGDLKNEIMSLRTIGRPRDFDILAMAPTRFSLRSVVADVIQLMHAALDRQKISVDLDIADSLDLYGPQTVLQHVLLNLVINTVDAASTRRVTRPMTLHLRAFYQHDDVRIRIWDNGPGINLAAFQTPNDIFKIGTTTHEGTGMGLAVARNLLTRHFAGSLTLMDPRTAMFEIRIKANAK